MAGPGVISPLGASLGRGLHLETFEPRMLLSADLIPVAGSIDYPGKTDLYSFELAEERALLFDSLTADNSLRWSLAGPGGQVVGPTAFTASDGHRGGSILSLGAGTYMMRVEGVGDHQADYQFRLLNVANAVPIEDGRRIEGVLGTGGRETSLFRFDAAAGTDLYFDALSATGGGWDIWWSLIDPDGNTVFAPRQFAPASDPARLTVPKDGTYTLLLEGDVYNTADRAFAFSVERVVDEARDIDLDTPVFGRLTQSGQRHELSFSLDMDTRLILDSLTASTLRWSLTGPRGVEVANRELRSSDGWTGDPVLDLIAGDYVLTVGDATDRIGDYGFLLHRTASAEAVSIGEPVAGRLTDRGGQLAAALRPSATPMAAGPEDGAFQFGQTGPLITVADDDLLRPETFTVETWLRVDAFDQYGTVWMKSTSTGWGDGYGLYLNSDGTISFFVDSWSGADSSVTAALPEAGEWVHVAASFDGASLRLQLNGEVVAEQDFDGSLTHSLAPLVLGASANGWYRLRGAIDEFRLWDSAQSAEAIAARHAQRIAGAAEGLALSLGFDHGVGPAPTDRAGRGLDIGYTEGPGTETRLFRFDGSAGDRMVFAPNGSGNIYLRVFGPSGQEIAARGLAVVDPLVLPEDGSYLTLIEGYAYDNAPRDFSFLLMPKTTAELDLTLGTVVNGEIAAVGQAVAYGFTLDTASRLYLDSLTNRSDIVWSLVGPRGSEITQRAFSASDASGLPSSANPAFDLPPGAYTLLVDGVGAATGAFAFRLFDLAAATAVARDAAVEIALEPARSTALFSFDAERGERIGFADISGNPYARLIDPFGRVAMNYSRLATVGEIGLQATGRYTLLVEGFVWDEGASQAHGFTIADAGFDEPPVLEGMAHVPGTSVSGTVAAGGEMDDYVFTLDTARRLYFDVLEAGHWSLAWSLTGPRGDEIVNRALVSSDGADFNADASLALIAGTYRLRIASGSGGGTYGFRLLDLDAAAPIALDNPFSGTLDPKRSTHIYRFEGSAGQSLVLDTASVAGASWTPTYRVIDPWGREIRRGQGIVNAGVLTLAHEGTHTLLIEGRVYEGDGTIDYSTALREVVAADGGTIAPGETLAGVVPGPRGSVAYSLTLDAATTLVFDGLSGDSNATLRITGPGAIDRSFNLRNGSGGLSSAAPVLALGAGAYTVTVTGSQNTRPEFAFRLLDAALATEIGFDEPVGGTLDPAAATALYAFEAEAGQVFTLAEVTNSSAVSWQTANFRIIDPFGRQLVGTTSLAAQEPRVLPFAGRYLLLVEGRGDFAADNAIAYGFTLQDPQSPAPRSLILEERMQGEVARPGQRHVFEFDLDADSFLYLDSFTDDFNMRLRVQGPQGLDRTYRLRDADSVDFGSSNPVLKAAAGSYTVTIWKDGAGTGAYDFSLRDLAAGAAIAIGERVEATLEPRRETDIYRFEGTAGESFLFNVLREQNSQFGVYWRLIDPAGNVEINRPRFSDRDLHSLARSGTYTLLIEGRTREPETGAISYGFVLQPAVVQEFPADLDAAGQYAGLDYIAGPGGRPALAFNGFNRAELDDPATNRTGSVSFELWFRPDTPQTTWTPLIYSGEGSSATRQYSLWLHSSGYAHLSVATGGTERSVSTASGSVNWNDWNHVVGVIDRDRNIMRLYLNGNPVSAATSVTEANQDHFGIVYRSKLEVETGGTYRFTLGADDGATLRLREDRKSVV